VKRRHFITLLGGAGVAWPIAARAQQPPKMPTVGFLNVTTERGSAPRIRAFKQGLSETGYLEGQSVAIEYRWGDYHYDRLPALASDLVQRSVDVIVAPSVGAALAAKAATTTIPIVFYVGADPVDAGLVTSLNRPSGNLTGVSNVSASGQGAVGQKRLELLHEVIPGATKIGALVNPANPGSPAQVKELEAAARSLGIETHVVRAAADSDLEPAFKTLAGLRIPALVIAADLLLVNLSEQLAALTIRHGLPAIHQSREFANAGGLMSYGSSFTDSYRQIGTYAGRLLKGEKPADLPVQQTTRVELIINLKTARTFGLAIPLPLLGRADEVIE
jgi:putative tryptophan/tyrosine transport system substrate-binding protein